MVGQLPINLVLSLLFGLGQLVVGAWLAWYPLTPARRGQWRIAVLLFVGLWLMVSGAIELFVSGMETGQHLAGAPSMATFTLLRGRADTLLFGATAILAIGALAYPLAVRWRERR